MPWTGGERLAAAGDSSERPASFPMYVMCMRDFLALETLRPHDELRVDGLLSALPDGSDVVVNFVSHQWTGYVEADPEGAHLSTMQDVFRRAVAGQCIFRSECDRQAYLQGYTKTNAAFVKLSSAGGDVTMPEEAAGDGVSAFARALAESYVWMDFISLPQKAAGYSPYPDLVTRMSFQQAAIPCIPSYVERATNFWVCAPSGTRHSGSGSVCDYSTWKSRGWCRMEECCLALAKAGDGRPLLVTQPLGGLPRVTVLDSMDRLTVHTQRHTAVLTGSFTCCRLGYCRPRRDGGADAGLCDKERLFSVLTKLYQSRVARHRAVMCADASYDPHDFWSSFFGSLRSDKAFFRHLQLRMTRNLLLAKTIVPPEHENPVARDAALDGASDALNRSELEEYIASWGLRWPIPAAQALFLASMDGNLRMMRLLVQRFPDADFAYVSPIGLTMLHNASRIDARAMVQYLLARVDAAHVNHTSGSTGVSALTDAAMRGHPEIVSLLLAHGADVRLCRRDGKSALHCAAEHGHAECVRRLLATGADLDARDEAGHTPLELVEPWDVACREQLSCEGLCAVTTSSSRLN